MTPQFINFVYSPVAMQKLREIANFSRDISTLDCTHIRIGLIDSRNAQLSCCHHGFHSIIVQYVCDAERRITNIVEQWHGRAHDIRIFDQSTLEENFEQGRYRQGILLGDAGFPCLAYLMTPFHSVQNKHERRYQRSHTSTCAVIELTFGVWKRRFPCLRRKLTFKNLNTIHTIIVACAVLYNVVKVWSEPEIEEEDVPEQLQQGPGFILDNAACVNEPVARHRAALIEAHFDN